MTYYDDFGGHETFAKLVREFYRGVAEDEALRALYPEQDLGPAEERLRMFFEQYWGGPTTYSENLEKVIPLIKSVVHQMDEAAEWQGLLLEEPQVVGVESMTGTAVTVRILAKTAAEQQYGVSREIRERVKAALDEAGVQGPPLAPFGPTAPQGR